MFYCKERFKGKNILVTGGTSGIGKETCIRAGLEGGFVIVSGRNTERGEKVVEEIKANGGQALFIQADMQKEEDIFNLFKVIEEKYGHLDVVINNAGIMGKSKRIDQMEQEDWSEVINTNLNAVFLCCREASRNMIANKVEGAIVNVSSVAGITGVLHACSYVASKHGVNGLTKAIAADLAPFNIRCNSVNPASTQTPILDNAKQAVRMQIGALMAQGKSLEEAKKETIVGGKTESLQKRTASASEQASTILYLASDEATHITGSIVASDGGYTAY